MKSEYQDRTGTNGGPTLAGYFFGSSVTALGDVDGDGVGDIAVVAKATVRGLFERSGLHFAAKCGWDGEVEYETGQRDQWWAYPGF